MIAFSTLFWQQVGFVMLGKKVFFIFLVSCICMSLFIAIANYTIDPYIAFTLLGHLYKHFYHNHTVPDLLLFWVVFSCAVAWFIVLITPRRLRLNRFAFYYGLLIPIAYFLKFLLKIIFNRPNPRDCLANPSIYGFHWFKLHDNYTSFPSGHMLIASISVLLFIHFYPFFKKLGYVVLFVLGCALVLTEYHFVSDVVAGAFLGYWLFYFTVSFKRLFNLSVMSKTMEY